MHATIAPADAVKNWSTREEVDSLVRAVPRE